MLLPSTPAVVLSAPAWGENHRRCQFLTLQYGRIEAVAYGARGRRSGLRGRIEPFSQLDITLQQGRGHRYSVSHLTLHNARLGLRADLERLTHAARLCAFVQALCPLQEPVPASYARLVQALNWLCDDLPIKALVQTYFGLLQEAGMFVVPAWAQTLLAQSCLNNHEGHHLLQLAQQRLETFVMTG